MKNVVCYTIIEMGSKTVVTIKHGHRHRYNHRKKVRTHLGLIISFNFMFVCYLFFRDLCVCSFLRTSFTTEMANKVVS